MSPAGFTPLEKVHPVSPVRDKSLNGVRKRSSLTGFTLLETLFSALTLSLLTAGLFYALQAGELSTTLSSTKVDLQAEVRRTIDWITRDVRASVSWDIADTNNSPSGTHIKFRRVQGWDTASDTLLLSNNYIEYNYDADTKTITRRTADASNNTLQTWSFNNIIQSPFYTRDTSNNIVPLNASDLLTSRKLIIVIVGQKQVRGALNTSTTATEEVKIRNE